MTTKMTDLTNQIYQQLLELYIADLEVELLAEKLKNVSIPQIPVPNPWTQPRTPYDPYYYGPPWIVTCEAQNGNI